jgi:hypothetical protein
MQAFSLLNIIIAKFFAHNRLGYTLQYNHIIACLRKTTKTLENMLHLASYTLSKFIILAGFLCTITHNQYLSSQV